MSLIKEAVTSLHNRLKELTPGASAEQLAYLAKSIENIGGQGTLLDIVALSDEKLIELADAVVTHQQNMTDAKDNHLIALEQAKNTHTASLINSVDAQVTQIDNLAQAFQTVNDVPDGSSIMAEVADRDMVETDALPFLMGTIARAGAHYPSTGRFTTELGKWTEPANAYGMFKILTGAHDYGTQYNGFRASPDLKFFQGKDGSFVYSEMVTTFQANNDVYLYPLSAVGVVFITNDTDNDITQTLEFGGASGWNSQYEGAGLFLGVPNQVEANHGSTSQIDWSALYVKAEGSDSYNETVDITFPANKTSALMLYNAAYHIYGGYNHRNVLLHWNMKNIRSGILQSGLSIDKKRTLKAWQCPGLSHSYEIWH